VRAGGAPPGDPRAVADLVARARRTIVDRSLLKGGERVVVAVSGGPDSLALLHVLHRLCEQLTLDLHVAHLDHRLRSDSGRDAAFVARAAARRGLPATVRSTDVPARRAGLSPEEAAREVRLAFLGEVADGVGADAIATGHTLDDRAETVLMRLLQGTGARGLGGIPPRRGRFIRPFIDARRAQTEAFCRALRLRPRADASNADPAFLRNLLRTETIPMLRATVNDRLPEALVRLADVLADEDVLLEQLAAERIPADVAGGRVRLSLADLEAMPVALQRRAIRAATARAGVEIGFDHTEAIRRMVRAGDTGARIDLPSPLNVTRGYGFLLFGRASSPEAPASVVELAAPGETALPPWGVRARAWIASERPRSWPDGRTVCVVDADRIVFPLRVRAPRAGDRFRPLGMARSKKVGDFFTDEKVEAERRAEVPLVVGGDDTIVWIAGHRIDDRAKVVTGTARFLWLAMEEA